MTGLKPEGSASCSTFGKFWGTQVSQQVEKTAMRYIL